jgi:hypothetical protein
MSQSIPLTRGYTALVDDSDYDPVHHSKWLYIGSGYAGRFVTIGGQKKLLYLHRFLLDAQPDQRIDHINGDRLDNRRANLRLVTLFQNQQNRKCPTHTASNKKGVNWHRKKGKWHVRISVEGTRIHLGYYDDLETAAQVYDAAARHFFNGYARPNDPDQPTSPEIALLLAQILWKRSGRKSGKPACGGNCALCTTCGDHGHTPPEAS